MTEPIIRPYRDADRADCYEVCVQTGAAGADARGLYSSDALLPDIFCGPYLDLDAESAFVVDTGDHVAGYVIAAPDTREFVRRYQAEVLPAFAEKYPRVAHPASAEEFMVALGHTPERMLIPQLAEYPAHLHIDLLPELQGMGMGRRLIDTIRASLAARGIRGVHLVMDSANTSARAFYDRLGFVELPTEGTGIAVLGISTD